MSILIKGMEMPTSCLRGGCPIDGASCSLWEEKYWKSADEPYRKRHPKCPLVELPPHGRLIDADVVERKHGKWYGEADGYADGELVYDMWSCPFCGKRFEEWDDEPTWNFCPNCGADMRGEDDV